MMNTTKKCCFTGHRPKSLPFGNNENDERCVRLKVKLKSEILKQINENHITWFITGMACGVDVYAAEIVLDLKNTFPEIILECAIPCEAQAVKWNESDRDRYFDIISRCDKETMLQKAYTADCMQKRNRYMVNESDVVIAIWNGKPSGTGSTVRYANAKGKEVVIINPNSI